MNSGLLNENFLSAWTQKLVYLKVSLTSNKFSQIKILKNGKKPHLNSYFYNDSQRHLKLLICFFHIPQLRILLFLNECIEIFRWFNMDLENNSYLDTVS